MTYPAISFEHPATLPAVLRDATRRHAERTFLITEARRWRYRDVERKSARVARTLLASGVGKATRVGLLLPNSPDWIVSWFAAGRIGALTFPLSTFFEARELEWALRKMDIDTLVTCPSYLGRDWLERLERAVPGLKEQRSPELWLREHPYLRRIVVLGPCDRAWATRGFEALRCSHAVEQLDDDFLQAAEAQVTPSDLLVGICTSGSTSEPKVVIHTHGSAMRLTHALSPFVAISPDEVNYSGMPFFWIGGLNVNLLPVVYAGAAMLLTASPRPDDVIDAVLREKATRVSMWKAQVEALLARARERGVDLSCVRRGLGPPRDANGDAISPDRRLVSMMGMTESFGPHSVEHADRILPPAKAGNWGCGLEGMERRIVNPETGQQLPTDHEGELWIRGFAMAEGYYKRERSEVFTADGWFRTSDLARLDEDGYIYFNGRLGDMIKTAGANVAAREVEDALVRQPGVFEAIVLGLPDEVKGERVVALVVPTSGERPDPHALRQALLQEISAYKVPTSIALINYDEIPRTDMGKPRKNLLRAQLQQAPLSFA